MSVACAVLSRAGQGRARKHGMARSRASSSALHQVRGARDGAYPYRGPDSPSWS